MPKIDSLCILKWIWAAWTVNDFGEHGRVYYGLSNDHARTRAAKGA